MGRWMLKLIDRLKCVDELSLEQLPQAARFE